MKKIALGIIATAPFVATSCSPAKTGPTVTISSYGVEYLEEGGVWHKELEKRTGLNIKVTQHSSNEELYRNMESIDYDIIMPSEYMAHKLADENRLEKLDFKTKFGLERNNYLDTLETNVKDVLEGVAVTTDTTIIDYMLPYANGDLRFILNKDDTACVNALNAVTGNDIKDNGVISVNALYNSAVNQACKTIVTDDVRNVSMLASIKNGATNADVANNPDANDALKSSITALKNAGVNIKPDGEAEYSIPDGESSLLLGYNSTQLWVFDDVDNPAVTKDKTWTLQIKEHNNLWVDGISLLKDPSADAVTVYKALFELRNSSAAIKNGYNSPFTSTNNTSEFRTEKAFKLSTATGFYGSFKYKKGTNKEYNTELRKIFTEAWG